MKSNSSIYKMYHLTPIELRQVQMIELEMLLEVDRICKKNNIKYCISAGTQLGAIRHGGFIPWDDDVDVALMRKEYEQFREACKTDLDHEKFYFQDQETTEGYRWGYGKLRRKNTKFIRLNQEFMPYEQGIFIDLMPYDYVPDNYLERKVHALKCFFYRKSFWATVGKRTAKGVERFIYMMLDEISDEWLFKSYSHFVQSSNRKSSSRMRILTLPVPGKEHGYESRCLNDIADITFEGSVVSGMKHYDAYLSYKYGDYMTLPSKENRKVHPVSTLETLEIDCPSN